MRVRRGGDCALCEQPRIVITLTDDEALLLRSALRDENSVAVKVRTRLSVLLAEGKKR